MRARAPAGRGSELRRVGARGALLCTGGYGSREVVACQHAGASLASEWWEREPIGDTSVVDSGRRLSRLSPGPIGTSMALRKKAHEAIVLTIAQCESSTPCRRVASAKRRGPLLRTHALPPAAGAGCGVAAGPWPAAERQLALALAPGRRRRRGTGGSTGAGTQCHRRQGGRGGWAAECSAGAAGSRTQQAASSSVG